MTDLSDVTLPGSHDTHRVIALAVRVVVEDGLAYRNASWQLWRDHRIFVPFATIQNWVEAGGKKSNRTMGKRLPGVGAGRLFRLSGSRRTVGWAVLHPFDCRQWHLQAAVFSSS